MRRPHILHIVTDQHRWDAIGALGWSWLKTPTLDRLVREGTTFDSAYSPVAECVPARASMISGLYADKTRCGSNADLMPVPETAPSLMQLLADGGYRTHGVGKCHFTPDPAALRGFQTRDTSEEIVSDPGKDDYLSFLQGKGFDHVLEPNGVRGEMYYHPQVSPLPPELHHSSWVVDRARDFVQSQKDANAPWYLYCGFIDPHPPFNPPNPWHKLYRSPEMPLPYLPENRDELICFINRFQNRYKYRDRGLDLNLVRSMRAYYAASISFLDYQLSRLFDSLEAQGVLDDTLIIFTSDHGEYLGDYGCFGKRGIHDASLKIPLLARLPGAFEAGARVDTPVSLVDLLPTFTRQAGLEAPDNCDGEDLVQIAQGKARETPVFFHYGRGENAILGAVDHRHKYAWSVPDQRGYLFARGAPENENLLPAENSRTTTCALAEAVRRRARETGWNDDILDDRGQWRDLSPQRMPSEPDTGLLYQDPEYARPSLPDGYDFKYPRENFLGF